MYVNGLEHSAHFAPPNIAPILPDSLKLSQVAIKTKSGESENVIFYKKTLDNGTPDYNQMWFITPEGATGKAKYFDFDMLLIGVEKLK